MIKSIILHEISQEIQDNILLEKWFPNFFHALLNYQLVRNYKYLNDCLFPYINLSRDIVDDVLQMIGYSSDYYHKDISYILTTINKYKVLNTSINIEEIIYKNGEYFRFRLPAFFKINQLRIPENYVKKIQTKYKERSIEDIIALFIRFSMILDYGWSSRSIANATTLMVPKSIHSYICSLSDNSLECYSCVLNANSNKYCSIFIDDKIFDGCMGPFCLNTLMDTRPKLLFANPPYDNGSISILVDILLEYHKQNNALTIITINRKDGGLYDQIGEVVDNDMYDGLNKLLNYRQSKLLDILVVPNYLMTYEMIDEKILGIKRDTTFIFYGDNITNTTLHDLKHNILTLVKDCKNKNNVNKFNKIKYTKNFKFIEDDNPPKSFNYKKSMIENHKLLSKIF